MHEYTAFATELKFILERKLAEQVRSWVRAELKADPYASDAAGDGYQTTTLYFDTPNLDLYFRRRSYGRAKYRIRRYNDSSEIFLERKMKVKGRLFKRRTHSAMADLDFLSGLRAPTDWSGHWFARRVSHRRLLPVSQIAYDRTARVGMSDTGPVRLTLDVNLRATPISVPRFSDAFLQPILPDNAILEMKYRVLVPPVFERLIAEFGLMPSAFSKYRAAMKALELVSQKESDQSALSA